MFQKGLTILLTCTLICGSIQTGFAQDEEVASSVTGGPRRQLATIIFSGLAGAILGLSTLSFYGRPQDQLSNIVIGFAIGVIGGTIYTTFKVATRPRGYYGYNFDTEYEKWETLNSHSNPSQKNPYKATPLFIGWSESF